MSWWTLGAEEEEEAAPVNTRPNRDDRGRGAGRGRGYTPYAGRGRGANAGRGARARPAADIPKQQEASTSEPESIFSALGRTVNQYLGVDNDDNTTKNTTGSAKYTNAPVRASRNASEAERRANEMADAMAWLNSPEAAAKAAADAEANSGSDNWWENEDEPLSAGIADDVSIFSNASDFKTSENVPDLMTMLRQKQDENAREREREESENERKRKLGKLRGSTRNARQQAKKMGEAVSWWKDTLAADSSTTEFVMDPLEDMKHVTEWWEANKDYVPVTDKAFNKKKKKAMKIRKALGHGHFDEMEEEKKARELKQALAWWQTQKPTYVV